MRVWDARTGRDGPGASATDEQQVNSVRFSRRRPTPRDGGRRRRGARVGCRGRAALAELRGHRGPVLSAAFVPGTDTVVSGGEDGMLRALEPPPDTQIARGPRDRRELRAGRPARRQRRRGRRSADLGHRRPARSRRCAGTGSRASRSSPPTDSGRQRGYDGTVRIWDCDDRQLARRCTRAAAAVRRRASIPPASASRSRAAYPPIVVQRSEGGDQVRDAGAWRGCPRRGVQPGRRPARERVRRRHRARSGAPRPGSSSARFAVTASRSSPSPTAPTADASSAPAPTAPSGSGRLTSGRPVVLRGHEGPVASAAFDPTGRRLTAPARTARSAYGARRAARRSYCSTAYQGPAYAAQFSRRRTPRGQRRRPGHRPRLAVRGVRLDRRGPAARADARRASSSPPPSGSGCCPATSEMT